MNFPRCILAWVIALFGLFGATGLAAQPSMSVNAGGWTSVWTPRGSSGIWDAVWSRGGAQVVTVMEGSINGRDIAMRRLSSTDGVLCEYRGTLAPDGRSASGTQFCPGSENLAWTAQLQGAGLPGLFGDLFRDLRRGVGGSLYVSAEGWSSHWKQRGASSTWDAVWTRGGDQVTTVMEGQIQGDQITMRRTSSSDGVQCEYHGQFGPDRRTASGVQRCQGHADIGWSASLDGPVAGGPVAGGPIAGEPGALDGQRYRFENLDFGRADPTVDASRTADFVVDFARCTVREMARRGDLQRREVRVSVCQPNQRLAFASYENGRLVAEYDWVVRDDGRFAAGVWRARGAFGPSVGTPAGPERRRSFH